ncbi:MAG: threonylcarbamoyl-AMP synthase [Lentimicrobiaceae bacterium]|jgi:L-threonylcarbamoyladenylate synthase|nr:threonylcarbamoyl-AMP synthase [Lentimicrobiaceae bacterium]MDG1901021.1 L-threonylcarbamoyladenylate synthase [Bacteroidales bacterium]MDG2081422.1 L-threonylcarbamoyladenylate synthase [Bacteroidales bacterium]|tara:strand:+ start:6945 stop:7514 length:570 start_codon:yes stop_codon:yes gene_type:complete
MTLEAEIEKSVRFLKEGKILLYPTDTVWGIGCDATNSIAITKIYKLKGRSESKGMIVLIDDQKRLSEYVKEVPPIAQDIIENSKLPLTIIYPGAKNLAKNIIAADGTIAIRIVKDEYCSELIKRLGKPIISTSANFSDMPTASSFDIIDKGIRSGVDYVVKVFQDKVKSVKTSTIIKLEKDGSFTVIRK